MQLWTLDHAKTLLPAVAVMLLIALGLRIWLGKKSLKVRMIPLQIATCVLLLLEVGKQVLSLQRGYDLYHLPFHYCSLFLFVMPVMAFYRGKYRQQVNAVGASICAAMFLLLMIYPCLIYSDGNIRAFTTDFFSFHTVAYHNLVVFLLMLILALDLYTPSGKKEQLVVILFIVAFCVVSASMAHILKTNYANYYSCNIPILETVRLAVANVIGEFVAKLVYIFIVSALNVLFTWGAFALCRIVSKRFQKKTAVL